MEAKKPNKDRDSVKCQRNDSNGYYFSVIKTFAWVGSCRAICRRFPS